MTPLSISLSPPCSILTLVFIFLDQLPPAPPTYDVYASVPSFSTAHPQEQGSLYFFRQRVGLSIEYDKQKIKLAVIIIVNFYKSNFECFW